MKWCFRFLVVSLCISCSQPANNTTGKKRHTNHQSRKKPVSDAVARNPYDTLSYVVRSSHALTSSVKIAVEVQPLVDYDSNIVNNYFGTMRFRFLHRDTQYVTSYNREQLQKFDFAVCLDTIMLVGNDTAQKKCSFIVNAGRYASDNLFYFYIVLNYAGKELLFETYSPCDLPTNSRFGYALTCKGLYRLDKKIKIPNLDFPTYMTMVDTNMIFFINGEGSHNAMFYDLQKKTIIQQFTFNGIYDLLNIYATIAEYQNPYRLVMLDTSGLIRVFSSDMQEWKMHLNDLPVEDLKRDDKNVLYFSRYAELVLVRMNRTGMPVAWKKE